MEKDTHKTKVYFRRYSDGDVIAIFPFEKADYQGNCMSYMHVGQHGACDPENIVKMEVATPKEYAGLKAELESIGYFLQVMD